MITKRILPCLDVKDGRVVKGVNFAGLQDVSSPVELAEYYTRSGADELVFYDITASAEGRGLFPDILRRTASRVFIPLTVGGGINTLEDFDRVLKCGADKVSVNSGGHPQPGPDPSGGPAVRQSVRGPLRRCEAGWMASSGSLAGGGGMTRGWRPSAGSNTVWTWGPGRWWSTPLTPTESREGLTWRCWPRCAGGEGTRHCLRRRGAGGGLCPALPDPARGGRGPGGLGVPFWRDCIPHLKAQLRQAGISVR